MSKIKVFLSYSHIDQTLVDKIREISLSERFFQRLEIIYDAEAKSNPSDIYSSISKFLNKTHVALALITESWLQSRNTWDELIRAHERRKSIYCLLNSVNCTDLNALPYFIRADYTFNFEQTTFEMKIVEIFESILEFRNQWQLKVLDNIRKIGDWVELEGKREVPRHYTIGHFEKRLDKTSKEIENIMKDSFSINVSSEQNFLETARPYFEHASQIFAVSLVNISTFWTDKSTPNSVKRAYLRAHQTENKEVYRLFVFNDPKELNYYREVLTANYNSYGRNKSLSGVLVCSYSSYWKNLKRWCDSPEDLQNRDFAILKYRANKNESHDEIIWQQAILSRGQMNISHLATDDFQYDPLYEFTKDLTLKEHELERLGIFRWEEIYSTDSNALAKLIKLVFKHYTIQEVIHSVYFYVSNPNKQKFEEIISSFQNQLDDNKEKNDVINTYFRTRIQNHGKPTDSHTGGNLHVNLRYNYAFTIIFKSLKAMYSYYEDEGHSKIRRELYQLLNPETSSIYTEIDNLLSKKNNTDYDTEEFELINTELHKLQESLERKVLSIIPPLAMRTDWENVMNSEIIVQRAPFPFRKD